MFIHRPTFLSLSSSSSSSFGLCLLIGNRYNRMVATRKTSQKICTISTRKVGAVDCLSKCIPYNLWWSNCSHSSNRTKTEKNKPCYHPWIFKDNSTIFQKKKYCFIQDYLTVELEPPVKKNKQTRPSSIIIDDILLPHIQAADHLNLSIQDYVYVSSLTSLSSDTFEDELSFLAT